MVNYTLTNFDNCILLEFRFELVELKIVLQSFQNSILIHFIPRTVGTILFEATIVNSLKRLYK